MIRITKRLLLALVLSDLSVIGAWGQTINAASCSANDVATALGNVAADGTTVVIPACTSGVSWGAQTAYTNKSASVDANGSLTYNQVYSTTLTGQGNTTGSTSDGLGNPTGYNDRTLIIDNIPANEPVFNVIMAAGKSFRMTGISISQGGSAVAKYHGEFNIGGLPQSTACSGASGACLRLDHNHFHDINIITGVIYGWTYGVIDHNFFEINADDGNGVLIETGGYGGRGKDPYQDGNGSWNDGENYGTANFVFLENNTFNWTNSQGGATNFGVINNCDNGGRFVIRYNSMSGYLYVQTHPQEGNFRACRAYEVYGNVANTTTSPAGNQGPFYTFFASRGGTGLIWGNILTGYGGIGNIYYDRDGGSGNTFDVIPSGWGYAGTCPPRTLAASCTAQPGFSAWDGNTNSYGYPAIDQLGRGKGDLLINVFPNLCDATTSPGCTSSNPTWPHQAVSPVYFWNQTFNVPSGGGIYMLSQDTGLMAENRDYYLQLPNVNESATFNGTAGIGSGAQAPTTSGAYPNAPNCTAGANGTSYNTNGVPGVGYWDTTNKTLYVCTATNTWNSYYTPYTYPHPLTQGTTTGSAPAPPTNLTATPN